MPISRMGVYVYEVEDGLIAIAKRLKEGRKINATIIWRAK
jgi:hypothetical protein